MSFYLKEAVVRRKDIVDRLLKLGDSIEILSNPTFSRNSDDARGILLSYKSLLDTHLPSSKYSKYEDVFYNWAIDHQGHRFDDLKTIVVLFEDEYFNKLRSIDKSPQIFSTSLKNSLTIVDLYEIVDLIEEKQRYSTKNIKDSDDSKYEAVGIYPLHVDFKSGNNLSNFILEFIEGEHEIMIVKPKSTEGSIFWSQAGFVNESGEEGLEGAYDCFNRLDAEDSIDTFDFSNLISKERRHSNTVTWCTSTANPAGNMFLGYAAGSNTHLYYSFNPFKDKTDRLRRFCTGLTYNENRMSNNKEDHYVEIEKRADFTDSATVDAGNSSFKLQDAIKEWKKYSPKMISNVNKDLSQNPQTEPRAAMMHQTFDGFLEKCKSLPVMQSITYKLSTNRFISTLRNGDVILTENKDLALLKDYFAKEKNYIYKTKMSTKINEINKVWRDFLIERNVININAKLYKKPSTFGSSDKNVDADHVFNSFLDYFTSIYCTALFNTFDDILGLAVGSDDVSFLEKYNLMHGKYYKKHPDIEDDFYDDFKLTFEDDEVNPGKKIKEMKERFSSLEDTLRESAIALFDFIENGLENISKESFLDYSVADIADTKFSYSKGAREDLGGKLDAYVNISNYNFNLNDDKGVNHAECIRIITSISEMNFEDFKSKFLSDYAFRSYFNSMITSDSNFSWSNYGKLTSPISLVQTVLDQISRQQKYLSATLENKDVNFLVHDVLYRNVSEEKEDNIKISDYYKILFDNIDELFSNQDFYEYYKKNLSYFLEDVEGFVLHKNGKKYDVDDLGYEVEFGTNLDKQDMLSSGRNMHIDFSAFYESYHRENIAEISSSISRSNDLLVSESELKSFNKKNIPKEYFVRNYKNYIEYLTSNESLKKTIKKVSKSDTSGNFKKDDVYWGIITAYGFEFFYSLIKTFLKEIKQIGDESLYENFKTAYMTLDYSDSDAKTFEFIEMPLLKNGLKRVFEDFFIHKQNPNEGPEAQKLYNEFSKTSNLVPEEAVVTAGHHLPWEIIV